MRRVCAIVPLTLATLFVAGCGSSTSPPTSSSVAQQTPRQPSPSRFLRADAKHHAVDLTLIAADGDNNNGFNFDGYGRGELLVTIPRGWRVTVHCKNAGTLRNSCAIVSGPRATAPAFAGATIADPTVGLGGGASETFSFTASRPGTFRIASLVPGHELARMYAVLVVSRGGNPAISGRPGP
jgi:hypothetical protein